MKERIKQQAQKGQFMLLLLFVLTWLAFGLINPSIFTMANLFSLVRASISPAIFSLAMMLVMLQGGIDMLLEPLAPTAPYYFSPIGVPWIRRWQSSRW